MGSPKIIRTLDDYEVRRKIRQWIAHPTPRRGWADEAACRNTPKDEFYGWVKPSTRAMCATCPVASDCLAEAMQYARQDDEGYRAGTNNGDRAVMLRMRREVA